MSRGGRPAAVWFSGPPKSRNRNRNRHVLFANVRLRLTTPLRAAMSASEAASVRTRCDFWLVKKNRKCGMLAKAGETRCGNHREHGPERVACAHCKTSVSALGLEKHLRRCPALANVTARTRAPYFVRDVNAGDASAASLAAEVASRPPRGDALRAFAARVRAACAREGVAPRTPRADPKDTERCRLATRARRDAQRLAATRGGAVPPPLEPRHAAQHASIVAHMADAGLVDGTENGTETRDAETAHETKKDATRKPLYAELGAGRGYLSHFLLDAYGPLDLVLVEREAVRFKAERSVGAAAERRRETRARDERRVEARARAEKRARTTADATETGATVSQTESHPRDCREEDARALRDAETVRVRRALSSVERLRVDIKDLDFSGVETARDRDVVFVGKHLCGAATDLALRCALPPNAKARDERHRDFRVLGACVATCCHHRCEWGSYVNRAFIEAHGFDAREFGWLARVSSWAVDGAHEKETAVSGGEGRATPKPRLGSGSTSVPSPEPADAGVTVEAGPDVSARERLELGGMAKTFLDVGRLRFLESRGFEGAVRGYCAREVSPENRLLVAKRKT